MSASTSTLSDCREPTRNNDGATPTPPSSTQLGSSTRPPRQPFFDPWNSSSSGHQRAENCLSGSTSWRASRGSKLGEGPRTDGQRSLVDIWRATKAGQKAVMDKKPSRGPYGLGDAQDSLPVLLLSQEQDTRDEPLESAFPPQQRPIFEGLCFFVNGSTAPLVSDHRFKHMLSAHGGRNSIVLGRRTVTHVVLGAANTNRGCGLAATKMQKEVARTGGKAIKYVTVEWVLESIKTGRRLPESRFAPLKLAHESQAVVLGTSNHKGATGTAHG
ncbi:hypothetical protein B5807_05784 [Epicoccum nigrum]|uniref:BRCT domain-containing protein n=1 Tax=Epicoccum nigrum TaxID=105696 RepID=A0A1Y2LZX0_EPING|nr:hypothetical protein B5807_05784 [Epicoccum nigrum]